jgi:hypothetical protein
MTGMPESGEPIPAPLQAGCYQSIIRCQQRICSFFHRQGPDAITRKTWDKWFSTYKPPFTENVDAYVKELKTKNIPFIVPLKIPLWNKLFEVKNIQWTPGSSRSIINPDFEYDAVNK